MKPFDWLVLLASLAFVVAYGLWRGRRTRGLEGYFLADHGMRWPTIALSIMATQASAITFLSTPGQAYADGMRFVQFYFGLPVAMVILCATAVPLYRRWNVVTAYEYLEDRFDLKTRTLAAFLFLVQRGLAAGLTIYAPALVLSVLLGWNLHWTNVALGAVVVLYTASGGTKAVNHTQFQQMLIMLGGLAAAVALVLAALPRDVGLTGALHVAGKLGRLNAVDFSFDPNNRYNFWSGLLGGCFLALSYFGTDQSQVGRYLAGRSVAQSRMGLVFNGLAKVPMQFVILLVGALIFVYYQFVLPPLFFNPVEARRLAQGPHAVQYAQLEAEHRAAFAVRERDARALVAATRAADPARVEAARGALERAQGDFLAVRERAVELIKTADPGAPTNDTNYVFLAFVLHSFPTGMIGLVLAAVFAASMSSTSAELNALASTSVVDVSKRLLGLDGDPRREVRASRIATAFWGAFAIAFAEYASRLGSLVEAVNILGSLFYGTILGIFLTGFHCRRVGGTAVFAAAVVAELAVLACFRYTRLSFLWYNALGCLLVVSLGLALSPFFPARPRSAAPAA